LDRPTDGRYILDGADVKGMNRNELAKFRNHKIGFVFQSYNLLSRTTALENVELPLFYNPSVSSEERKERAISALKAVKMSEERFNHTPNQLSGGQQQRVAIARALVNEPVLILADEATGNLDTRTSYEIMMVMQELNEKENKTIVFVTHEPDIAAFSNRTILLRDGKLVKDMVNENKRSARDAWEALPKAEEV
jgi:putative ABC transport system ATP-binding protein